MKKSDVKHTKAHIKHEKEEMRMAKKGLKLANHDEKSLKAMKRKSSK